MNKKRKGFTLIELLISTVLVAMSVITLNKLMGVNLAIKQQTNSNMIADTRFYAERILFDDIKTAYNISSTSNDELNIYTQTKIINYKIRNNYLYRNNEQLIPCSSGYFAVAENTVSIMIMNDEMQLKLKIQGGEHNQTQRNA